MDHSALKRLVTYALENGASRPNGGFFTYEWDISGRCERPVPRELYAAPPAADKTRMIEVTTGTPKPLRLIMFVKCRKCESCMKARGLHWKLRAEKEISLSARTWFGTLTLGPSEHQGVLNQARAHARARLAVDFDTLSPEEQFRRSHKISGALVTKYLKRVRKESSGPLRHMIIAERHKSGLIHYHGLVHEMFPGLGVTERLLRTKWTHGFSKWNVVQDQKKPAAYVTKYLTKSSLVRVRASKNYGSTT